MIVYVIENIADHKVYVGSTTQTLSLRWSGHKSDARGKSGRRGTLHDAIRKFGSSGFVCREVYKAKSMRAMYRFERSLIRQFASDDEKFGYNRTSDGGPGRRRVRENDASPAPLSIPRWMADLKGEPIEGTPDKQ